MAQKSPAVVNRGIFLFPPSVHLMSIEYISAVEHRPVFVRAGSLSTAGEPLFHFLGLSTSGKKPALRYVVEVPCFRAGWENLGGVFYEFSDY